MLALCEAIRKMVRKCGLDMCDCRQARLLAVNVHLHAICERVLHRVRLATQLPLDGIQ
jgi:hypothetical protein